MKERTPYPQIDLHTKVYPLWKYCAVYMNMFMLTSGAFFPLISFFMSTEAVILAASIVVVVIVIVVVVVVVVVVVAAVLVVAGEAIVHVTVSRLSAFSRHNYQSHCSG